MRGYHGTGSREGASVRSGVRSAHALASRAAILALILSALVAPSVPGFLEFLVDVPNEAELRSLPSSHLDLV